MTDDVVLVEYTDAREDQDNTAVPELTDDVGKEVPQALQIVSIGTEEDAYAFTFHEERLNSIMSRIPPGWKVAVVSVVGAFRTGKSFLLSWFLRYLHHLTTNDIGNVASAQEDPWYLSFQSLGNDGFDWRGGSERNTTGIWAWSQPQFVNRMSPSGEKETMAVVLVDSQGMFDNETTMSLTASIFGLSTLLSSYQIYNVDKRIQEDNLQQLALFAEYARMAAEADVVHEQIDTIKPFQRMEFLVRDWQHFEDEENLEEMQKEMEQYLEKVMGDRDAKDLKDTREQISSCFESLSCFGLCHPGMKVVKKKFSGDVKDVEELFLQLLDRYCKQVFHIEHLEPKCIQGKPVTAAELGAYVKAYAEMFASGANFPEASTMLEATASANNSNAVNMAVNHYKDTMNRIAGPKCSNYIRPKELKDDHRLLVAKTLDLFDSMATFGNKKGIEAAKVRVREQIEADWEVYQTLNDARNPLAGLETYLIPMTIAFVSFLLRWIADATCSPYSSVCKKSSDLLSHVYAVVICFLLIVGATKAQQVKEVLARAKSAFEIVMDTNTGKKKKD